MAYEQGLWGSAIESYSQALAADPLDVEACRGLAETHAICGNLNTVVQSYLQLMDILCEGGNFTAALQVGEWVKCIRPESYAVRAKNVRIFLQLGDTQRVVQQSLELARLYVEFGQGESAIALLVEAQKADPLNLAIGLELAETCVSQGLIQDGARHFAAVGSALVENGELERACEAFRRLKLIGTGDSGVLLTLGNIYVQLGRYNEAEHEYRSALRQNLNHQEALFALGSVCQLKGQWRDAILAFNRILTLNPEATEAQERLGELYQQQSMQGDAIKHYLLAAQAHFAAGERERAVRLYQVVLGLDPSHPVAARELAVMDAPVIGLMTDPAEVEVELPRAEVVEPGPGLPRIGLVRTSGAGLKDAFRGKRRLGQGDRAPALVEKLGSVKPALPRKLVAQEPVIEFEVAAEAVIEVAAAAEPLTDSGRLRRSLFAASGPLLPPPMELLDEILGELPSPTVEIESGCEQLFDQLVSELHWVEGSLIDDVVTQVEETVEASVFSLGSQAAAEWAGPLEVLSSDLDELFSVESWDAPAGFDDSLFAGLLNPFTPESENVERPLVECLEEPVFEVASLPEAGILEAPCGLASWEADAPVEILDAGDSLHVSSDTVLPAWLNETTLESEMPWEQVELARGVRELSRLEDVPGAIRVYRESMEANPENLVLRAYLADLHLDYGMLDDAVVQFRQVLQRAPQSVALHHRLVQAQLWNDQFEEAASTLLGLSELHLGREERAEALDVVQSVLSLIPHHLGARRALVALLGESELVTHHLEQLAESAVVVGALEVAAEALSRLQSGNDHPGYQERLAQVLEAQGRASEALLQYRGLAARFVAAGEWARAAAVLGRVGAELRAEVMRELRGSAEGDLARVFAYGELCFHLGELDCAIEQFQQTRRDPELQLRSFNGLARCFARKSGFNMAELAIRQFRKGLETPGYDQVEYAELRYNLAVLLCELGREAEAAVELRLCPEGYRDAGELLGGLGMC